MRYNNKYLSQHTRSLIRAFASRLIVKLLTEHHLEFLSLHVKGGCRVLSKCWKSHAAAHLVIFDFHDFR